jgi:hypothetical protein
MTKLTNTTTGPKGVNTTTGLVYINAGQTSEDLDLSEAELASAESTGHFAVVRPEPKNTKADDKKAST